MIYRLSKFPTFILCCALLIADLGIETVFPSISLIGGFTIFSLIVSESIASQDWVPKRAAIRMINPVLAPYTKTESVMAIFAIIALILTCALWTMVLVFMLGGA